jgi:hypothetical protein
MKLVCVICKKTFECAYRKQSCSDVCKTKNRRRVKAKVGYKLRKTRGKKRYKSGYREDLGFSVRSGWEANIARLLKYKGITFEFEPKLFDLVVPRLNKKPTVTRYLPDFILADGSVIEVKGRHVKSLYKPRLLRKQYGMKVYIIDQKVYNWLKKRYSKVVPHWE